MPKQPGLKTPAGRTGRFLEAISLADKGLNNVMNTQIDGYRVGLLLDTGAADSCLSLQFAKKIKVEIAFMWKSVYLTAAVDPEID